MDAMNDGYVLKLADPREAGEMHALMRRVWELLDDKDLFAVDEIGMDWFEKYLSGDGFGVTARGPAGELAGILLVCFPGMDEENYGWDVGLSGEDLLKACNMEMAAVLPEHRGHRLEQRLLAFAERELEGTRFRWMLATVSPNNPASLRSGEKCGYTVLLTKEKYGGHLRHILGKAINGGSLSELPAVNK